MTLTAMVQLMELLKQMSGNQCIFGSAEDTIYERPMEQPVCEQREVAMVVLWDWSSVQVPLHKITLFIHKVRSMVGTNTDQRRRECAFLVFCDARITPPAITREIEKSLNVDIHHVEAQESAWGISKKLYRFHVDYDPGVVVLISGASTAYRPVLTKLTRCGWRVQLIHPYNSPKEVIEHADESCSLETLLGGDIGESNTEVDFPNAAYFALSELGRAELAIEMLNNVAEQYESKVIYFNERAAEAVIELRAFDIESAISLLTARLRARSPASGAVLETSPYHLELLPSASFLANINIAKLICERDFKAKSSVSVPHSAGPLNAGLTGAIGPTMAPPYPLPPLNLIQQFAFPYRLDSTTAPSAGTSPSSMHVPHAIPQPPANVPNAAAAAAFNVMAASANAHAAAMLHQAATLHPYAAAQMAAAAAAAQLLQQPHPNNNASNHLHPFEQQNTVVMSTVRSADDAPRDASRNDRVTTSVCSDKFTSSTTTPITTNPMKVGVEDEDARSHREAKIEVFSEDEEDYDVGEDSEVQGSDEKANWETNPRNVTDCNEGISAHVMQHYSETLNCSATEEVNEYPLLPAVSCSDAPLRYSAVVKGAKPTTTTVKPPSTQIKESGSVHSHRSACTSSSVSTQMSQWDEVVVERGGKFSKPAPQCIHWNNPKHRLDFPCRFWHPREQCRYYPNCSSTADECGFAHPFCADFCHCPKGKRDPQKNHRLPDERYFGGGDRVKYGGGCAQ